MDEWGWEEPHRWLDLRVELPVGPLLCVINGSTCGLQWSSAAARAALRRTAVDAGVAAHHLRHTPMPSNSRLVIVHDDRRESRRFHEFQEPATQGEAAD
jgi:hypothetical protein